MTDFLAFQVDKLHQAAASLLSPASIFSLPQLVSATAIAFLSLSIRRIRRRGKIRPGVVWRAMWRRRILFHRSTGADLFYYFVNTFAIGGLIGWGLFSSVAIAAGMVALLRTGFGIVAPVVGPDWALRAGLTLVAFLAYEFGYYLDHYLKHKIPVLWAFHKTHHTAEVLTPLTVFRVHPLDTLIFVDIVALSIGLAQGVFTYAIGRGIDIYAIQSTNIVTVGFLFLLAHLQHSQFWMPLTGLAGHVVLSPAHHQLHHSADAAHYNRNLGSFLAIWDWLFGTLLIPEKTPPRLRFGLLGATDDPHRIGSLLIEPVASAITLLQSGVPVEGRSSATQGVPRG